MPNQHALLIVQAFLQSQDAGYFGEEAEFQDMTGPAPVRGRGAVSGGLTQLQQQSFDHIRLEPRNLIADEDTVVAEWIFHAVHTGLVDEALPSGRPVMLPMIGVYEVDAEKIQCFRLYYDAASLRQQIGLNE